MQRLKDPDIHTEELQSDPERSFVHHLWSEEVLPLHLWKKVCPGYGPQTIACDVWTKEGYTSTGS